MKPETKETIQKIFGGPNIPGAIDASNKVHLANVMAIQLALFDKGVITPTEYARYHTQAIHYLDQIWQKKIDDAKREKEESLKALEEEIPIIGKVIADMVRRQKDDME